MAYDEDLADRLRDRLAHEQGLSERRMFGGLGFMLDGHLAVAAGDGGILLRCDPGDLGGLLADPAAEPMVMRGRPMKGWLRVRVDDSTSDEDLAAWIAHGVRFVRSLGVDR